VAEPVRTAGQGTQAPAAPTVSVPDTGRQLEAARETARRQGLAPGAGARCGRGSTSAERWEGSDVTGGRRICLGISPMERGEVWTKPFSATAVN